MILSLNPGDVHDITVERQGEKVLLDDFHMVKAEFPDENGGTSLRYGFSFAMEQATFTSRLGYVWDVVLSNVQMVKLSLQMLLSGQAGLKDLGGPVMIVDQMAQVAEASPTKLDALLNMIYFGAFLAINLAVMNLLPIPALDGGHIVFTLYEMITGKKPSDKFLYVTQLIGMIFIFGLMFLAFGNDIARLIK